jgi:hypothetical protein
VKNNQTRNLIASPIIISDHENHIDLSLIDRIYYLINKLDAKHSVYHYNLATDEKTSEMKFYVPIELAKLFYLLNRHQVYDFQENQGVLDVIIKTHNTKSILCYDKSLKNTIRLEFYKNDSSLAEFFEVEIENPELLVPTIDFKNLLKEDTLKEFFERFADEFLFYANKFAGQLCQANMPRKILKWFQNSESRKAGFSPSETNKDPIEFYTFRNETQSYRTEKHSIMMVCDDLSQKEDIISFDNEFQIKLLNLHLIPM